jgi:ubiquinone biosynthesis protein
VTERFGMKTRTELILLQRTMVVVEGVARSLDPQANIWTAAKPVVEDWMRDNLGPKAVARDLRDAALVLTRYAPRLPELAERLLTREGREVDVAIRFRRGVEERFWPAFGGALAALLLVSAFAFGFGLIG